MTVIPQAALTQHIAILGKTGAGKTTAAKGLVEPILERGSRVAVVDPTGAWWGLRSSRDGKGPGFPVLVLGGEHGDMPLPPGSGEAVAKLVSENGINLVADTSSMTVGERTRWFTAFASAIYRLNRTPLHLVLDEAHNFAPQGRVPDPDAARMLHATNSLASGGRSRGVRLMLLTQRPQKLHKDTLTSADTLIAMRVLAPQDRDAVKSWIDGCGDPKQGKEVLGTLASLSRGEGWVWYPEGGVLKRATFASARTFDSSATPVDGKDLEAPRSAEVDLTEIRAALADSVREAEENDPRALRAEVAKLRRQLANPVASRVELDAEYKRGRVDGYEAGMLFMAERVRFVLKNVPQGEGRENPLPAPRLAEGGGYAQQPEMVAAGNVEKPRARPTDPRSGDPAALPKAERLILTALAQYPDGRSKSQVAILTGYAVNGGGFSNSIGALRSAGRIVGGSERLQITTAGSKALGSFDPLPSGADLLAYWIQRLGKAERKCLEVLADVYPRTLSKAQVAGRAGYEAEGGGFNNALGRLRALELISGRGEIRASKEFFE